MSRSEITSSLSSSVFNEYAPSNSTKTSFFCEIKDYSDFCSHTYHFDCSNTSNQTAEIFVLVSNSKNPSDATQVFKAIVAANTSENFSFSENFNFKYAYVRIDAKQGDPLNPSVFRVYETHNPSFKISSTSSGSPGGPLPPPYSPTPTPTTLTSTPTPTPVTETATLTPVTETATLTPVTETATLTPVTETATLTPVTETATLTPVTETATLTPVTETATLTPVTETATLTPVTETATLTPVTETATLTPVTETATLTPVTETATLTPVTETATLTPVTETATLTPVTETATLTPVTETATLTPVTETATLTPVTETATLTPVTETATLTPVTETATPTLALFDLKLIYGPAEDTPTPSSIFPVPTPTFYTYGNIYERCELPTSIEDGSISIDFLGCEKISEISSSEDNLPDLYVYNFSIVNNNWYDIYINYKLNGVSYLNKDSLIGEIKANSTSKFSIKFHQAEKLEFQAFAYFVDPENPISSEDINVNYDCESCAKTYPQDSIPGFNYIYGFYHDDYYAIEGSVITVKDQDGATISNSITNSELPNNFNIELPFDYHKKYTLEFSHPEYQKIVSHQCFFDSNCESSSITLPMAEKLPSGEFVCKNITHEIRDLNGYSDSDPIEVSSEDILDCGNDVYIVNSTFSGKTYEKNNFATEGKMFTTYISKFTYTVCYICPNITGSPIPPTHTLTPTCIEDVNVTCGTPTPEPMYELINLDTKGGSSCCDGIFNNNEIVQIEAQHESGYKFSHWIGSDITEYNSHKTSILMNSNKFVKAIFERNSYYLSVKFGPGGSAKESGFYESDSNVDIEAQPFPGYEFDYWHIEENEFEIESIQNFSPEEIMEMQNHLNDNFIADKFSAKTTVLLSQDFTVVAYFKKSFKPSCTSCSINKNTHSCSSILILGGPSYEISCPESLNSNMIVSSNGVYQVTSYIHENKNIVYKEILSETDPSGPLYLIIAGEIKSFYQVTCESKDSHENCTISGDVSIGYSNIHPDQISDFSEILVDHINCTPEFKDQLCETLYFDDLYQNYISNMCNAQISSENLYGDYTLLNYDPASELAFYQKDNFIISGEPYSNQDKYGGCVMCGLIGDICVNYGTYLTEDSNPGSNTLNINNQGIFSIGDQIIIAPNTDQEETHQISSFGSLILSTPTENFHKAGTIVIINSTPTTPTPTTATPTTATPTTSPSPTPTPTTATPTTATPTTSPSPTPTPTTATLTPTPSPPQTYNYNVSTSGFSYVFSGDISGTEPNINANIGDTLTFNLNVAGHPFMIRKIAEDSNSGTVGLAVDNPTTTQGLTSGSVSWTPQDAGTYYYQCQHHESMLGEIIIS